MFKSKHNIIYQKFFDFYGNYQISKHFHNHYIIGSYVENNRPLLYISNHYSWWDGFWINKLNQNIFQRNMYFLMLESQLNKHSYFYKTGGIPINKSSRSLINSLNFAAEKLGSPHNALLIFPQGKIETLYKFKLTFEKGVYKILKDKYENIDVILICNLIEYSSNPKPTLFTYYKQIIIGESEVGQIEDIYNDFYLSCLSSERIER